MSSRAIGGGAAELDGGRYAAEESIAGDMALRKAEEAASRRYQAVEWLREMDHGAAQTLPAKPSEEEFCFFLRNGLILCNVLNKVNPGSVLKIVENPVVSVQPSDGPAQSAIQYFENMRNFLVAVDEMKLLTFESSDIEKGGSSIKVVDCILCLKGYHEWKLAGVIGIWRYGGIVKIAPLSKETSPSFLGIESADQLSRSSVFQNNQHLVDILHLFTEICLEESRADSTLFFLFDQFGLRLLQTFLAQSDGFPDLPLDAMLIDMVLDKAVQKFEMLLASQRNKLGILLKDTMKVGNASITKADSMEAFSRYLTGKRCDSLLALTVSAGDCHQNAYEGRLDHQQKQLDELKLSLHEVKLHFKCSQGKWKEELKTLDHQIQCLEHNSNSYYKLLEENRLLYNQVQDLKGNIRVYCRVRPFLNGQLDGKSTVDHIGENGNIMIVHPHKEGRDARKIFSFNKVFGANATQHEVFADTQPLIRSVLDGYNVCIFAYGQTGSGKTYTMSGPDATGEDTWGVNYRALRDLFSISKARMDVITYEIGVQMIEIYNEQVRDLLVVDGSNKRLDIRNNSQMNGLNIPDASLVSVRCTEDVLHLMEIGQRNRATGATALNERSSRSHSVITVLVQGKELASGAVLRGCLHLVDLAGSERVDKSEATGERLKEAQHINRSLSALGDVISALAQKSSHIPYRNSKLTQVLQDALGGHAKTLMFVHINSEENAYGETISTLKFAERVASIELGAACANKESGEIRKLKEEISKLKSALERKESEAVRLKDHAAQLAVEVQNWRATSPVSVKKNGAGTNLKHEDSQHVEDVARKIETRSCSSGKQRKPHFMSSFLDTEFAPTLSFSTGENNEKSTKWRSPSPLLRRSPSTDRATIIKSKSKAESSDQNPVLNLQSLRKTSMNRFVTRVSTVTTSKGVSEFLGFQEVENSRTLPEVETEGELKLAASSIQSGTRKYRTDDKTNFKHPQFIQVETFNTDDGIRQQASSIQSGTETEGDLKPAASSIQSGTRKYRTDEKTNFKHRQLIQVEKFNTYDGIRQQARNMDDSEIERDCKRFQPPLHSSLLVNKLQRRAKKKSENKEPRAVAEAVEQMSARKHENKPQNKFYQNEKVESNSIGPDMQRSRSIPRGRLTMIS